MHLFNSLLIGSLFAAYFVIRLNCICCMNVKLLLERKKHWSQKHSRHSVVLLQWKLKAN